MRTCICSTFYRDWYPLDSFPWLHEAAVITPPISKTAVIWPRRTDQFLSKGRWRKWGLFHKHSYSNRSTLSLPYNIFGWQKHQLNSGNAAVKQYIQVQIFMSSVGLPKCVYVCPNTQCDHCVKVIGGKVCVQWLNNDSLPRGAQPSMPSLLYDSSFHIVIKNFLTLILTSSSPY